MKVSKAEYQAVVLEVAERLKDVVYGRAEYYAGEMLRRLELNKHISDKEGGDNPIRFTFSVEMFIGDIRQIINRIRREK